MCRPPFNGGNAAAHAPVKQLEDHPISARLMASVQISKDDYASPMSSATSTSWNVLRNAENRLYESSVWAGPALTTCNAGCPDPILAKAGNESGQSFIGKGRFTSAQPEIEFSSQPADAVMRYSLMENALPAGGAKTE